VSTLSKNIFWSSISSFLQIYTGGIIFIVLARIMSIEDFGLIGFGFSLGTILTTCFDFGHSLMIMKDYPQKTFMPNNYVFNTMVQKLWIILFFTILFLIYLWIFYEAEWFLVGIAFIIFAMFSVFVLYLQALMRVKNQFNKYTISVSIYAALVTVVVLLFYFYNFSVVNLIVLMIISKSIQLIFSVFLCKETFNNANYDSKIQKYLKKNSWSYAAHYIFGVFYFNIDTQIISIYLTAEQVAFYQSIFKLIYIFLIFSEILSNALLPYLAYKIANGTKIDNKANEIFYFLLIIGCSLFLFLTALYQPIIDILFTKKYESAYVIVLPLSLLIILRTVASIYGNLLTISNNQKNRVKVVLISLIFSLGLNILIIPQYGILGAAWSSVIVHMILLGGYYFFSKKEFSKIKMITKDNSVILTITMFLFAANYYLVPGNFIMVTISIILWCFLTYWYSNKSGKISFLKMILKEKGVG